MSLCVIIPAAGRGSRLGFDKPKLLVSITEDLTIWDVLRKKLLDMCDHLVVVMSPEGAKSLQKILLDDPSAKRISVAIQETPAGMGDAVMKGRETWQKFNDLCVIWGDQVHVSQDTLKRSIAAHTNTPAPRLTLPLVRMDKPYVEYCFDEGGRLERILQSREGDSCHPGGLGDIGTFLLSVNGLESSWRAYEKSAPRGEKTGEINFLPFLVYLTQNNWNCTQVMIGDADEARGINTPQDLEYFRRLYKT